MYTVQLFIFAAASLTLACVGLVALTAYKSRAALRQFKKKSAGLPILPAHWLHNHANLPVLKDIHHTVGKFHRELRADTVGWLYRQQFCVSTVDLDLVKILNQDEVHQHIDKLKTEMPIEEFERSIVAAGGEQWRRARRVFAPALRPKRFMTPVVQAEVKTSINKLINHIEKRIEDERAVAAAPPRAEFELDGTSLKYSLDLVFRCFYRQPDEIDFERPDCKWARSTTEGFKAMQDSKVFQLAIIFPILVPLVDWLMWHFTPIGQWRQTIVNFVKAQTKRGIEVRRQLKMKQVADHGRNQNGSAAAEATTTGESATKQPPPRQLKLEDGTIFEPNMFDYVIDKFLEGKLTRDEYINNSCFLMPAASKTAGDAIGHTLYLLAIDSRVQEKLRAELRTGGGPESAYLDWVVAESLRLFTPASSGCGRVTTRDIKTKEGHVVPAGTFVTTLAMVIHRLEKYWGADANEFKPERWADTSGHHPFQYMPFGGGLRICPGREFALFQMKTLLTELLTRYKFSGTPNPDIYHFDSPYLQTSVPYSLTYVTIERL